MVFFSVESGENDGKVGSMVDKGGVGDNKMVV
jgi:hypothetical protein